MERMDGVKRAQEGPSFGTRRVSGDQKMKSGNSLAVQ